MAPPNEGAEALTDIERELDIAASPETVFSLLTDSREQIRWMGTEATLEPHAGGLYRVNCTGNDVALGEFVEVVRTRGSCLRSAGRVPTIPCRRAAARWKSP